MFKGILEEIGLSKNEIKVYLALLKLGKSTSWKLTAETGIQVSALYYCLDNLIKKGLVSYIMIANKKHFQAASPEHLVQLLDTKKKQVEAILPELKAIQNETEERIQTNVYEGYKGFKGVYDRLLRVMKKGGTYYVFGARQIGDPTNETLHLLFLNFHKQREKQGIKAKILFNKDVEKEVKKAAKDFKHMNYRFIDTKNNSFILIYDNRIVNFLYTQRLIAIETISEDVYQSYRQFFEEMWKAAAP
ncbi:MAG TPA: helix-turn-helix domain-containing protein [Candidatus Nanoarchaeia archaeon]|nr:helix-turn-helix domain-containing protein [Candidatus Nanoarchaeia archaeon]